MRNVSEKKELPMTRVCEFCQEEIAKGEEVFHVEGLPCCEECRPYEGIDCEKCGECKFREGSKNGVCELCIEEEEEEA